MVNDPVDDPEKVRKACFDYLERHGQVVDVNPASYEEFINSSERKMEFLIKCIVNYRADVINENIFNDKWEEDDIYSYILGYLESMAYGLLGIDRETFNIIIRKPIGDPPSERTEERIKEKIWNARPLIRKVILENLERKNGGFKG